MGRRELCVSLLTVSQFKELSKKKFAVKLTQFRTSKKFGWTDLVIDRRTKVSEANSKSYLSFFTRTALTIEMNGGNKSTPADVGGKLY